MELKQTQSVFIANSCNDLDSLTKWAHFDCDLRQANGACLTFSQNGQKCAKHFMHSNEMHNFKKTQRAVRKQLISK